MELNINTDPVERHTPPAYVSIVAATTPTTLYSISSGMKARITKILVYAAVGCYLRLGYGAFTQVFPDLKILAGVPNIFTEDDLPQYWYNETGAAGSNVVGETDVAAVSPNDVRVFVEVEEQGLT